MSFDSDDSSGFAKMSGKTLAILFALAFFGAFMIIQMVQGFPLAEFFTRQTISEEVPVTIKQADVCVVETSDGQPKEIRDCHYNVGDTLVITFYEGSTNVESHTRK